MAAAKADVNQVVRHKSKICAAENPVLQDFQPITALRAVIEYALIISSLRDIIYFYPRRVFFRRSFERKDVKMGDKNGLYDKI